MSACRPPSIVPAGPPTSGKPMVLTTASTAGASAASVGESSPPRPAARRPCSCAVVSRSRTTVCASTPFRKTGTGRTPSASSFSISSAMYGSSVMTCLRYSRTATVGTLGSSRSGPSRAYHFTYSAGEAKKRPGAAGWRHPVGGVSTGGAGGGGGAARRAPPASRARYENMAVTLARPPWFLRDAFRECR